MRNATPNRIRALAAQISEGMGDADSRAADIAEARRVEMIARSQSGLLSFTLSTKKDYRTGWHHKIVCDKIDRFVRREIPRLMIFMPPRHGKSELVSRRLPAYIFGKYPNASVMACSYGADLSSRMNRDVQRIIDSSEYQGIFPNTKLYGKNVRSAADGVYLRNSDIFEIVNHSGSYRSAGVGGSITGMGFDYGIIDDPIKRRKEAESQVYRNAVWEWYQSDFYTRQEKDACILITTTRWHKDDLAGRLLEQAALDPDADQWDVIVLPALAYDGMPRTPGDERKDGEALWPWKYSADKLEKTKIVLQNGFQWNSLYQQSPTTRDSGIFKESWFADKYIDAVPAEAQRVRWWDRAATIGGGDYTAGVLVAMYAGKYYIEDVVRGQWGSEERDKIIRATAEAERENGLSVYTWGEQEPGSSGKDAAAAFVKLLAGFPVYTEPSTGSKIVRADSLSSQAGAGNVYIKRGKWNKAFMSELFDFPSGKNDDQVDGASGAFNKLASSASGPLFMESANPRPELDELYFEN